MVLARYESSIVVDPTGKHVAAECADAKGVPHVRLWELASGELVALQGELASPVFVGGALVAVDRAEARLDVFDLSGDAYGRRVRSIDARAIFESEWVRVVFARGDLLVLETMSGVTIIDVTGATRARLTIEGSITAAAADGDALVFGTGGGRVVWKPAAPDLA